MLELTFLNELPAVATAIIAIVMVLLWQTCAAAFLHRVLAARREQNLLTFAGSWLLVPAASGLVMLWLDIWQITNFAVLGTLYGITIGAGLYFVIPRIRHHYSSYWRARLGIWNFPMILIIIIALISTFYAAHPQWMYDQLAYHLVVPRLLLRGLRPATVMLDSHFLVSGTFEASMAWLGVSLFNDHLLIAMGQLYVWILCFGATWMIFASYLTHAGSKHPSWLLAIFLALAMLLCFPDSTISYMAKPDAIIMVIAIWVFIASNILGPETCFSWAAGLLLAAVSYKPTAFLPSAVFFCLLIGHWWRKKTWNLNWQPVVLLIGLFSVLTIVIYRLYHDASPFFPTDIRWIPSDFATPAAQAYWQDIAGTANENWTQRLVGLGKIFLHHPVATTLCFGSLIAALWGSRDRRLPSGFIAAGWFAVLFWLTASLLVGSQVSERFIGTQYAIIFVAGLVLWQEKVSSRWQPLILIFTLLVFGATCQLDRALVRLIRFNSATLETVMQRQVANYAAAKWLNAISPPDHIIVTNDQTKFYFNEPVLYQSLAPREIALWNDIAAALKNAKLPERVFAVAHDRTKPDRACPTEEKSCLFLDGMYHVYPRLLEYAQKNMRHLENGDFDLYVRSETMP